MKLTELITEDRKHEYGCAMLYFEFPLMYKIQDTINPKHLYEEEDDDSYGLDDNPHTTLLYGFHDEVTTDDIKKIIDKHVFSTCKIHNVSLFKNEKYEVLKFDVENDILHKINKELVKYPHTNSYPDYHPHMTIGYVKPGYGDEYVKKLKDIKFMLKPSYVIFSKFDGDEDKIKINVE